MVRSMPTIWLPIRLTNSGVEMTVCPHFGYTSLVASTELPCLIQSVFYLQERDFREAKGTCGG